jgi:protein-disulfide isomerase
MSPTHAFELAVPVTEVDHCLGAMPAPVTLVEYGDYECPNCKQAAPAVKLILKRFGNSVGFVYRHYPLEEVHPNALRAAEAAEAAAGQGRFWQMHDLLFQNQSHLKRDELRGYARKLGLDMDQFDTAMDEEIYLQRVREHEESARISGVRGTPTFFLNGRIHDVSYGIQALEAGVESALKA